MAETARRVFLSTLIVVSVVVAVLALWKLRVVIALLFLAFIVAASMRPSIEALRRRGLPRGAGIAVHYLVLAGAIGLLLWLIVPIAVDQVQAAVGGNALRNEADNETGWKHDALVALDRWLRDLPNTSGLVSHALEATRLGFEILVGIFFVFASAAYWIFERNRAIALVVSLLPKEQAARRARHMGPDRPQARRLRPGSADPDRGRRHRAEPGVLGHRASVLDPHRDLRGHRRDRSGDRTARRRRPGGRRRA